LDVQNWKNISNKMAWQKKINKYHESKMIHG
jgi:hypothetical protein